jgi:hypothetical protein
LCQNRSLAKHNDTALGNSFLENLKEASNAIEGQVVKVDEKS